MNNLKRIGKGLLVFFGIVILALYITDYDYILKGIRVVYLTGHTTAFIDDYPYFVNDTIKADVPQEWPMHSAYNDFEVSGATQALHDELGTVAFLIIKNDSILYERYDEGYDANSRSNSFSMAKSITAAMLGKAIQQGHIRDLDQPISDFYPQYKEAATTVGDLASMASGLDWDENYKSPFSVTARAYYDDDLAETILQQRVVDTPGERMRYLSGNTQLLGMIVQKATGTPLAAYLSQHFWQPMGMKTDALWQLDDDENRLAKSYCCIASNARDFARFGKLYKDHGVWNGQQLLDSVYVATSIRPRFEEATHYGYGFWLSDYRDTSIFVMRGILGQYVITIPEEDLIIVRLGKQRGNRLPDKHFTADFYQYIDAGFDMQERLTK